jgi:hypothetical protein
MSIANQERSALGPKVSPQMTRAARHRRHQLIMKILVGFAIALGCCVAEAAPASADPNPFGTLSCSCRGTAPADGADPSEEIRRGLREGLSAWLPGLPPPPQPLSPRP